MKMEKFKTAGKEGLKKLFTQFNDNLGLYTTVFVTVTYHLISEKDFACSCKPQNQQNWACWLHLVLPVVLLWFLLLLRDKCLYWTVGKVINSYKSTHQDEDLNICKCGECLCCGYKCDYQSCELNCCEPICSGFCEPTCSECCKSCCICKCCKSACCGCRCSLAPVLNGLYALSISSIWMASVLLDGDWWLCCLNDGSEVEAQVACKPPTERTVEEKSIAADLKSKSRNLGLMVLLIAAFVPFVRHCCKRRNHKLAEVILEEGQDLVFKLERKAAMKKLETRVQTHLEQEQWVKCSEAVEQLIIEMQKNQKILEDEANAEAFEPSQTDEEENTSLISSQAQEDTM